MPSFEALPVPQKYASGTDASGALRHASIRNARALPGHSLQFPVISEGTTASMRAMAITAGV